MSNSLSQRKIAEYQTEKDADCGPSLDARVGLFPTPQDISGLPVIGSRMVNGQRAFE